MFIQDIKMNAKPCNSGLTLKLRVCCRHSTHFYLLIMFHFFLPSCSFCNTLPWKWLNNIIILNKKFMQFCMKAPHWIYMINSQEGLVYSPDWNTSAMQPKVWAKVEVIWFILKRTHRFFSSQHHWDRIPE